MKTVINRLTALAAALVLTVPVYADFSALARAIDSRAGVRRIWIPFLGLARLAVRVVQPEGVHDFQLATFEGTDRIDPRELQSLMREKIGKGFTPLVQVWSKKGSRKEWSFIYARPYAGNRVELVILARDGEDTTLVSVDVDADIVARELETPRHVGSNIGREVARR